MYILTSQLSITVSLSVTDVQTRHIVAKPARTSVTSESGSTLPPSKSELPPESSSTKNSLDDVFTRLSLASSTILSRPAQEYSPAGPDKSFFSFEDCLEINTATKSSGDLASPKDQSESRSSVSLTDSKGLKHKPAEPEARNETRQASPTKSRQNMTQDELEQEYFHKAVEYVGALPASIDNSVHTIKAVSTKLHGSYTPEIKLESGEVEKLRARYIFAVVNYINKKVRLNAEPLTAGFVKKVLCDSNGSFLQLCAALVESKYLSLESLEHVTGLCKNILDVLPKAEPSEVSVSNTTTAVPTDSAVRTSNMASGDPLDGMKSWPTQEKREHGTWLKLSY